MNRREFVKRAAAAGVLGVPALVQRRFDAPTRKQAHDGVTLGATGVKVSRLAVGTGTSGVNHHSNQTEKLGIAGLARLLQAAHDEGITFWDSADQYGTHPHLREALRSVPRDKVVILTKTHASTADGMKADLDRFRRELGTDHLDIVLLHMMTSADWPREKEGAMEVLSRAREEGVIRAHGVSCHTFPALKTAAATDWVQVDLARINPAGVIMDSGVNDVTGILRRMHEHGKGIIGMKILGAGQLRHRIDECLGFVLECDFVDAFTIGQESMAETKDLVQRIAVAGAG